MNIEINNNLDKNIYVNICYSELSKTYYVGINDKLIECHDKQSKKCERGFYCVPEISSKNHL